MKPKPPNERLISIAAELVRGPNLDERFDLDDRLPKWAAANVERICDRQRELAIAVQDCTDKLMDRMRNLETVAKAAEAYLDACDDTETNRPGMFAALHHAVTVLKEQT